MKKGGGKPCATGPGDHPIPYPSIYYMNKLAKGIHLMYLVRLPTFVRWVADYYRKLLFFLWHVKVTAR
jgi:hypothetical protein